MSVDTNRLLYFISARKSVRWSEYCEALDVLSIIDRNVSQTSNKSMLRSLLLHALQGLCHCDVSNEEGLSTITRTPAILSRLPQTGLPVSVLTGARGTSTYQEMIEKAIVNKGVEIRMQRYPGFLDLVPDVITVEAESSEVMAQFAERIGLPFLNTPPAWTFANWCPTLAEYESTLTFSIPENLNWQRYDYDNNIDRFSPIRTKEPTRLSRYFNPTTNLPLHVFFREGQGAQVDLSWGLYLLFKKFDIQLIGHDAKNNRLCFPAKAPPPVIITKALTMCSGKPVTLQSGKSLIPLLPYSDWLVFEHIPPQISRLVLDKIDQRPITVDMPLTKP